MTTLKVPLDMPRDLRNYVIMLIGRISQIPHRPKGMAQREFAMTQKDISALREADLTCRYWDLYDELEANLNSAMNQNYA